MRLFYRLFYALGYFMRDKGAIHQSRQDLWRQFWRNRRLRMRLPDALRDRANDNFIGNRCWSALYSYTPDARKTVSDTPSDSRYLAEISPSPSS
ncbi:hypothetical protein KCP77_14835 [Salmonella enterica subsp. enterica]|nr:hypothetical protein KCP77_14835 [Salmonella enterica subsp. enterica]